MLRTIDATVFHRELNAGRTRPVILGCRQEDGSDAGEFVVKLRSEVSAQGGNSCFEVYGVLLAQHFDIATPEAVLVSIDARLASAIPVESGGAAARIRNSAGLNFGTRYLPGYRTWLHGQSIPPPIRTAALELFALDALIQNPDRGATRPNLLSGNGQILAIDHDAAFSFVFALGRPINPWELQLLPFLTEHVFYGPLRGKDVDLESFRERLRNLHTRIREILEAAPAAWQPSYSDKIEAHLLAAEANAERFCEAIEWRLAK